MDLNLRRRVALARDEKIIYFAKNLVCDGTNFFDTGFAPYTAENKNKNFKITIKISSFDSSSENQAVVLGCKYEGTISGQQWPGFYVRRYNQIASFDIGGYNYYRPNFSDVLNKEMVISRINGVYKCQVEGKSEQTLSVRVAEFNQNIVIGAGVQTNGTKFRFAKCVIDYIQIEYL